MLISKSPGITGGITRNTRNNIEYIYKILFDTNKITCLFGGIFFAFLGILFPSTIFQILPEEAKISNPIFIYY